jgi:predicted Zn-dependent peptidase
MDNTTISILCLNKNFESIKTLVSEIIYAPSFMADEFENYKKRIVEDLKMQLSKNDVLGYREITEQIFGSDHPYGYNSVASDYDNLILTDIIDHYNELYTTDNCTLFISGNINDQLRSSINDCIGLVEKPRTHRKADAYPEYKPKLNNFRVNGKQSLQKTIYIGRKLFSRAHPDYFGMVVLNTVLGGYFSSRLNKRIREKEPLCYGIDAQLDIMTYDGFFYISTEIENKNEAACLLSIHEELDKLRTELIPIQELENVKRYLNGQILNMLDGPFKQIKVLQSLLFNQIYPKLFSKRIEFMNNIDQEQLLSLAQKYYKKNDLIQVIVEGKS